MRALVVYESIFGNTRQIAEAIGDGLRAEFEVEVSEVGKAGRLPDGVDLVVVGGPTHAWGMSRGVSRSAAMEQARQHHTEPVSSGIGVRDWLEGLKQAERVEMAAAFDTAIRKIGPIPSGSAARGAASRLEALGYRLIDEPEQFFVKDADGPLEEGERERARAWGMHLGARAKERAFVARPKPPGRLDSAAAIAGHAFALLLIHTHAMWRPWTLGVVTERWAQAVDAMSLACLVGILGNVLLLMFPSRSLRSFIACAVAAANLAGAAAVYAVFPFDFGALGLDWFDPVMHVVLLVALIGAAIGLAFQLARLLARPALVG